MLTHELIQGSPQWNAYRTTHDNASDAPAMMGESSYKTRDQLIAEVATGIVTDVDAATQRLFNSGHRFEALARPRAEAIIGQDLYPCTGSLEGSRLSASFDGLTMLEDLGFEHKRLNQRLRAAFVDMETVAPEYRERHSGRCLPLEYQIQMEQQCAVSGCEKVLFMATHWADDDTLLEQLQCWYFPNLELRARIVAGWEQFHRDVAAWVPPEPKPAPVVAKQVAHLPVVFDMRVEGKLVACNLEQYKPAALAYIAAISTTMATDQDFADADADAKFCRDSADKLELAIELAMGQMGDINTALNTVREIAAAFDAKGLSLEKLVRARKDEIRNEIVADGATALLEHIAQLNAALPASYMPQVPADFAGVVKNKRTVESLRNAVNTELARAKIEASSIANRIHANVKTLQASGLVVHDTAALVLKAPDDLAAIIANRVMAEQQRQEAERERIRKEEQERADREAREKLAAEARAAQAAIAQAAKAETLHPAVAEDLGGLVREQHAEAVAGLDAQQAIATAKAGPVPDAGETMTLGQLNARLSPIKLDASDIEALGFTTTRVKAAVHFPSARFPALCEAIARCAAEAAQALAAAEVTA